MLDVSSIPFSYTAINFVLAMAMYTLMARFVMSIFIADGSTMVLWRVFRQVTDPILRFFRVITPAVVPGGLLILFSIVWIMGARLFLLLTFLSYGWINLGGAA
jgi:hypothetical protein